MDLKQNGSGKRSAAATPSSLSLSTHSLTSSLPALSPLAPLHHSVSVAGAAPPPPPLPPLDAALNQLPQHSSTKSPSTFPDLSTTDPALFLDDPPPPPSLPPSFNHLASPSSATDPHPPPPPPHPPRPSPSSSFTLKDPERTKLLVVLTSLDPAGILEQQVSLPDLGSCTLREAFTSSATTFPLLRTSINNATTSALFSSFDATPASLDAMDEFGCTALALIDEVEAQYTRGSRGTKRDIRAAEDASEALAPPSKKYMLHRGLEGMDLFTSSAPLNEGDLAQLATVPDTDVIAVTPSSADLSASEFVPSFALTNPRPRLLPPPKGPPKPEPVSLLYYDPFQSFAPSYDSSGSTLSYASSIRYRSSVDRLTRWETSHSSPLPVLPPPPPPPAPDLTEEEQTILRDLGAEGLLELVETDEKVWDQLTQNGVIIRELIKAQWSRLRKGENKADPMEDFSASTLEQTLLSLLASAQGSQPGLLPSPSRIAQAVPSIMASLRRDPSYLGTLDALNIRAVKESAMTAAMDIGVEDGSGGGGGVQMEEQDGLQVGDGQGGY